MRNAPLPGSPSARCLGRAGSNLGQEEAQGAWDDDEERADAEEPQKQREALRATLHRVSEAMDIAVQSMLRSIQ